MEEKTDSRQQLASESVKEFNKGKIIGKNEESKQQEKWLVWSFR
jgi:hypothetical protein